MPFLYVYVCDLLEQLAGLVYRDCPLLVGLKEKTNQFAIDWFRQHKGSLNEGGVDDQAVLASFMPEKRTDRDYGLDAERLEQLIARVLNLPRDLHCDLRLWRNGLAYGDLAACVERVMDKMSWVITSFWLTLHLASFLPPLSSQASISPPVLTVS